MLPLGFYLQPAELKNTNKSYEDIVELQQQIAAPTLVWDQEFQAPPTLVWHQEVFAAPTLVWANFGVVSILIFP